ncbi:sugar ABC transporter substrate-binding protein [Treponema parvum]|uniref:Sugar ABC transporter substrate-binding protein n=1 Tax=Treponema parvum TaxID=138851 RepID=A0A975F3V8_9SPIR|nr:sugar ABC transporter substrate-binding protein [Treponema parvum]QTQ13987.1 sugar ABC transporter substrate-binding protein [Treponema parvum]
MKKVFFIVGLMLSVSMFGIFASGSSDSRSNKSTGKYAGKTIGFVGMTMNNEYHITLAKGAIAESKKLGIKVDVQAGKQHSSADEQLAIIENMIANGVNGILLVPSSSEGLEAALRQCKEKNIPIINLDTKLTTEVVKKVGINVPFYGTNNYEGAKLAGEYVAANFPRDTKTAILKGIEGQTNNADRYNGFVDGAKGTIKIVAEQNANWEVDQGYVAAQNIISANPDVKLFFCENDNMGIGALRAIKDAGMQGKIKIMGFDAVSEALNLVDSGDFVSTVAQLPAEMGRYGVINMCKIFDGEKAEQYIDTGTKLILQKDVAAFKEYLAQFK